MIDRDFMDEGYLPGEILRARYIVKWRFGNQVIYLRGVLMSLNDYQ